MATRSAGILFYRFVHEELQVLLLHPGGPYWKNKDKGAWTIPKGEIQDDELPISAALREVKEETVIVAEGYFIEMAPIRQNSGKIIYAYAAPLHFDPALLTSNTFEIEWPPASGKKKTFPEIDKAAWFNVDDAGIFILEGQRPLLTALQLLLGYTKNKET